MELSLKPAPATAMPLVTWMRNTLLSTQTQKFALSNELIYRLDFSATAREMGMLIMGSSVELQLDHGRTILESGLVIRRLGHEEGAVNKYCAIGMSDTWTGNIPSDLSDFRSKLLKQEIDFKINNY